MNLTVSIESAELQFKQILEEFFISVYDEKSLSSHGIDHHRRVWSYAKELCSLLAERNMSDDLTSPFKLIIACYLHDIGMSVDRGIRHGHHSREICTRFLEKNNLKISDFDDVLQAIENHDNKEYITSAGKLNLLTILSVADDLDAFGFTGIYRYSEIYITRGIKPEKIGHLIRENAGKRFDNFAKTFGFADELVQKHKKRYEILDNFFNEYNDQVNSYQFGGPHPSGYCGVVEVILELHNNKTGIKDIYQKPKKYLHDPVICWFLDGLASELSE
ncbi:MAG: HD domain-containing protein [Bacteroidia bacterium]|nr:HD domain-containing protein [Bacteroidia bacterium]